MLLAVLFLNIKAEHSDKDRDQAQSFADDGADGHIDHIVDQPGRGTDQAVSADRLGVVQTEADGRGGHANDRQQLDYCVLQIEFLTEYGKGQNVGSNEKAEEKDQPCHVLCVELFFIDVDDRTESGDGVQNAADCGAQHKKAGGKQNAAEHLAQNNFCGSLLLERKNIKGHGNDAETLGDDIIKIHTDPSLFFYHEAL